MGQQITDMPGCAKRTFWPNLSITPISACDMQNKHLWVGWEGGGGVSFKVFVNCLGRNSLFSRGVDVEWGGEICSFKLTENTCGRKDYPAKLFKIQGFSTFFSFLYYILRVVFCSYTLHTFQLSLLICKYRSPKCFFSLLPLTMINLFISFPFPLSPSLPSSPFPFQIPGRASSA